MPHSPPQALAVSNAGIASQTLQHQYSTIFGGLPLQILKHFPLTYARKGVYSKHTEQNRIRGAPDVSG
jgi:hypothetical protein